MTPHSPFDAERPNIARVYDYLLGGSLNFEAERVAAREFQAKWPGAAQAMLLNRAFAGRAILTRWRPDHPEDVGEQPGQIAAYGGAGGKP